MSIRFHRACSWMARVEQMPDGQDHDLGLVCLWIAFNSLYGQWDAGKREPKPDRESWRSFVDRILKLDSDGHVAGVLQEHKPLVISLLDDECAPDVAELPSQGGRLSKPCWQCCKTVAVWSATVDRGYVDEVCDSSARQLPRQCGTLAMLCSLGSPASQSIRKTTKGTD